MDERPESPVGGRFPTTQWSVVRAAGSTDPDRAREALTDLCNAYWYPLYSFVRRSGSDPEDARDLVQGFFARFFEKDYLTGLTPEAGRFRSYLLASMRNYLSNERHRARARKRGGGRTDISLDLDFAEGERRHRAEPTTTATPETLFHQRWALTLLGHVLDRLRRECEQTGKAETFDQLQAFLPGGPHDKPSYKQAAQLSGLSMDAVKVTIHRLRRRYGDLLRDEVAGTVSNEDQIDQEIQFLLDVLSK